MPWVMAALTGAQMLQNMDAADRKRTLDAAAIRYSPWSKISSLPFTDSAPVDTAIKGYTGVTGQMQADKATSFQDKLAQAQIDYLRSRAMTGQPGSMMNLYQGGNPYERGMQADQMERFTQPSANYWGNVMNGRF